MVYNYKVNKNNDLSSNNICVVYHKHVSGYLLTLQRTNPDYTYFHHIFKHMPRNISVLRQTESIYACSIYLSSISST